MDPSKTREGGTTPAVLSTSGPAHNTRSRQLTRTPPPPRISGSFSAPQLVDDPESTDLLGFRSSDMRGATALDPSVAPSPSDIHNITVQLQSLMTNIPNMIEKAVNERLSIGHTPTRRSVHENEGAESQRRQSSSANAPTRNSIQRQLNNSRDFSLGINQFHLDNPSANEEFRAPQQMRNPPLSNVLRDLSLRGHEQHPQHEHQVPRYVPRQ